LTLRLDTVFFRTVNNASDAYLRPLSILESERDKKRSMLIDTKRRFARRL
jgi:hypothetical protein